MGFDIRNRLGKFWGNNTRERRYHPKVREAMEILRNNPDAKDAVIAAALHLDPNTAEPFIARARDVLLSEQLRKPEPPAQPKQAPAITTDNLVADAMTPEQREQLVLLDYSPEEILKQVADEMDRINFGQTRIIKTMETYGDIWALVGPLVLLIGTIGEVFVVLWERQSDKTSALAWLSGLAIVCVSLAMEGSFLAISWKSATIRNRADRKPGGRSALDKKMLKLQFWYWLTLAIGIVVTQVAFIIAQTQVTASFPLPAIIAFAAARSVVTLIADAYTAFVHQEKPTDGDQALEERSQRGKYATLAIDQRITQITTIKDAQLRLRHASIESTIKEEKLLTQLETERMQNKALIQAQVSQQETALLTVNLMSSIFKAALDPNLSEEERLRSTRLMSAMADANRIEAPKQDKKEDF